MDRIVIVFVIQPVIFVRLALLVLIKQLKFQETLIDGIAFSRQCDGFIHGKNVPCIAHGQLTRHKPSVEEPDWEALRRLYRQ